MRDRDGREHPDDGSVTWRELVWFFDREMAHRDRFMARVESDAQREIDRVKADAIRVAEKRAASNRWLIAVIALLSLAAQIWFRR